MQARDIPAPPKLAIAPTSSKDEISTVGYRLGGSGDSSTSSSLGSGWLKAAAKISAGVPVRLFIRLFII